MKSKKFLAFLTALTIGSALFLNGCSLNIPFFQDAISGDTTLSAELESVELTEGNVLIHIRCYDANTERISGATVTFSDGSSEIFSGVTDENGRIESISLPGNQELTCTIKDGGGRTLAESTVIYELSGSYEALSILALHDDDTLQEIQVPSDKAEFSAAIFVDDDQSMTYANLMPYSAEQEALARETTDDSSAPEELSVQPETTTAE